MTRFIHDQFAKQLLTELLTPYGQVETSKDITAEVRQIDVLFIPSPQPTQSLETLGILGRMAANYAIFEPFRNPVSKSEIRFRQSTISQLSFHRPKSSRNSCETKSC